MASVLTNILKALSPSDRVVLVFLCLLSLVTALFSGVVSSWHLNIGGNVAVATLVIIFAVLAREKNSKVFTGIHRWFVYPAILHMYFQSSLLGYQIHGKDYDELFIAADRWLFGGDPTVAAMSLAHPLLTEILQIAYFLYYFIFILAGVELFIRPSVEEFDTASFYIVFAFCISYIGYLLLPGVGPRWHLHEFNAISTELPGIFFTEHIRSFINSAEGISASMTVPPESAQRNIFPSGHTLTTLVATVMAFRYRIATRWIIAIIVFLLIVSTVYLRYHYVIDLVGSLIALAVTLLGGAYILRRQRKHLRS